MFKSCIEESTAPKDMTSVTNMLQVSDNDVINVLIIS